MKMLTKEWDWDVAKSVWKEESLAEGIQIGETRGIQIGEARSATRISALEEEVRQLRAATQGQSR
jgi:hypothetical protein